MSAPAVLDFSLGLALFDLVPVALTAVAFWFIARILHDLAPSYYPMAVLGGGLVIAGGLSKATWKLVAAAAGVDLTWLSNALFPLMAPGFVLLAVAVWAGVRTWRGRQALLGWPAALGLILIAFGAAAVRFWWLDIPRGWFLPFLVLVSFGNLTVGLLLIRAAFQLRRWWSAMLLSVDLAMIFALQPIAMASPKTIAMHWIEQSLTAFGTGCFAFGAYLLWCALRERRM